MTTITSPIGLNTLTEKLKFHYKGPERVGGYDTFLVDLSDWKLSLTDNTPCIWVQADAQGLPPARLADILQDVVRQKSWQNSTVLIFLDGEMPTLRDHLPGYMPTFVVFNSHDQASIQKADSPTAETLDILLRQMPRPQLAPYETHKPVFGSKFFGRDAEINRVLQNPYSNFLFIGIRRIGKTSLLKEIQRRMDQMDPPEAGQIRRVYIDCTVINSEEEFLRTLASRLDPSEVKLLMGRAEQSMRYQNMMFDRFASIHGAPITFLVDELDRLLTNLGDDKSLMDVLRASSNYGKARFIMAGFRRPLSEIYDKSSPFFNGMGAPIRLGQLGFKDIRSMILGPMERLRITIRNREEMVKRIFNETAGLPNYVQFYCQTLLAQVHEKGSDEITEVDLKWVYDNRDFQDFILETFMANTEPLEQAIVYTLVADKQEEGMQRGYSQRRIDEMLKKRKLDLKLVVLEQVCRNLEVAGVLTLQDKHYHFSVPLLRNMLRETRDINFLFEKTREEVIAEKLGRSI